MFDDDDEFGGAKLTKEMIYGKRKTKPVAAVETEDEEDEFGGAKLTKEMIYGKRKAKPVAIVEIEDEEDEFGGAKLTKEMIYGKRKSNSTLNVETEDKKEKLPIKITKKLKASENRHKLWREKGLKKTRESLINQELPEGTEVKLWSSKPKNNTYLMNRDEMIEYVDSQHGYHLPLVIDTEYDPHTKNFSLEQEKRLGLTTQIKGIHKNTPSRIYAHTPQVNAGRELHNSLNPKDQVKLLPLIKTDFHPLDYLTSLGYDISLEPCSSYECRDRQDLYLTLYGHFLLAEILMCSSGTVEQRILELLRSKSGQRIEMTRRLRCVNPIDDTELDYVDLNHIITINGREFNLCLRLVDTCAIHGVASYKAFCEAVGVKLEFKDNFSSDEKEDMVRMFIERFKDAEEYSLGDLEVYEALENYNTKWFEVYKLLGLEEYYQEPKLTIGGSVKDLFVAALAAKLEVEPDGETPWKKEITEVIQRFIQPTSANDLRQSPTWTRALLAKVEGGRCRNNRPTIARLIADIIDIDISGCYGEGQRNQDYFIGLPEIWDYLATAKNNDYVSLREWLKAYDVPVEALIKGDWSDWGELIPGAWITRISSKEPLKYPQDFFASWFTESKGHGVNVMTKFVTTLDADGELEDVYQENFDEEYGSLKPFNYEIHNGLLQHDGLEWIFAIATPRQRNELLDKLVVLCSAVYPKSQRINNDESFKDKLATLISVHDQWKGKNTTSRVKVNGRTIMRRDMDECHAWFSVNLGDLLINNLIIQRKIAQTIYGKKTPLDVLFKLCINTLYGDMVSKFFVTANPVVGNNITARARAMAWYMEKGFNGLESITDGCGFESGGVLENSDEKINGETINQHRFDSKLNRRKIKKISLGGKKIEIKWLYFEYTITDEDGKIKTIKIHAPHLIVEGLDLQPKVKGEYGKQKLDNPGIGWIDKTAFNHLRKLFPKVSILHQPSTEIKVDDDSFKVEFKERTGQFSFETKDVYQSVSLHGSANYAFKNPNGTVIKARGFNTKNKHWSVTGDVVEYQDDETDVVNLKQTKRYGKDNNPAKDLLLQLLDDPTKLIRQETAIKTQILKPSEYREHYEKYDALEIQPGDNIKKCFLMQEFSISQFTFKTHKQYMMWKKCIEKGKLKNKQSIEGYFLNEDGTLNFQEMIERVDEMIANDVEDPLKELDKNRNRQRKAKRTIKGTNEDKPVSIKHPQLGVWKGVRDRLSEVSETNEEI